MSSSVASCVVLVAFIVGVFQIGKCVVSEILAVLGGVNELLAALGGVNDRLAVLGGVNDLLAALLRCGSAVFCLLENFGQAVAMQLEVCWLLLCDL